MDATAASCPSCDQEHGLSPGLQPQQGSLPKCAVRGSFWLAAWPEGQWHLPSPCPEHLSAFGQLGVTINYNKVPGCRQGSAVRDSSFVGLCLPQLCPAQDTLGECFSLLKGPRTNIHQTARNVLLCQEKPAWWKLPSVLFLEVNVIVLSFLTGFARCYVPCWSRRSHEEAGSLTLGFELASCPTVDFHFLELDGEWCVSSTDLLQWPWRMLMGCVAEPSCGVSMGPGA